MWKDQNNQEKLGCKWHVVLAPGVAGHSDPSPSNSSFPGHLGQGESKRSALKLGRGGGRKVSGQTNSCLGA